MIDPIWITLDVAYAIHEEQLAEHGGGRGVRDPGLLESAVARPLNLFSFAERDLCSLAASYARGLAKNHPFVDGNKRTAFVIAVVFLRLNGLRAIADPGDAVVTMLGLADGSVSEEAFADWLRANTEPL